MAQIPYNELQIVPLTERDRLLSFNSISDELNEFLINDALEDQENMISKTMFMILLTRTLTSISLFTAR